MSTLAATAPAARRAGSRTSLHRSRRWALIASYVFLTMFAIFFLMPPYYMVVTALKSDAEMARLATNPWFIFDGATLDQFRILLGQTDFLIFFKNTVIVTVCVVAITMVVSVLAAFLARPHEILGIQRAGHRHFPHLPGAGYAAVHPDVPDRQIDRLLNSYWGMVLVYPTLTVPFCTCIMIGYFQSIPGTRRGGAHRRRRPYADAFKIFIPVALPGIIAAMIFAFTVSWAAFVYPMAFLYSSDQQVLTVAR